MHCGKRLWTITEKQMVEKTSYEANDKAHSEYETKKEEAKGRK
jgi:hypothetical protein